MAEWRNGRMAGIATGMMGMATYRMYLLLFYGYTNAGVGIILKREPILKKEHYHGRAKRQV